jgi:hypothetical protein
MHPDAYDLAAVRLEWLGKVIGRGSGKYPVEHDPIRRHCHMAGDANPLFSDPNFARDQGPYGVVIVPPSRLPLYFAGRGPWPRRSNDEPGARNDAAKPAAQPRFTLGVPTPGNRGINMATAWDYFQPIRVGDHLTSVLSIIDIFIKAIKLDDQAVWIVSQTQFFNQDQVEVARWRNTTLVHRSPKQIAADAVQNKPVETENVG